MWENSAISLRPLPDHLDCDFWVTICVGKFLDFVAAVAVVSSSSNTGTVVAPCDAMPLHLPRRRCALSMGLENEKLDGSSMVGWNGSGWVPGAWLVPRDGAA